MTLSYGKSRSGFVQCPFTIDRKQNTNQIMLMINTFNSYSVLGRFTCWQICICPAFKPVSDCND